MLLRRMLIRIGWTDSSSLLTIFNRYCNKLHDLSVTNSRCDEGICGNISILYAVWLWNLLSVELINSLFYQFKMLWRYLWQHFLSLYSLTVEFFICRIFTLTYDLIGISFRNNQHLLSLVTLLSVLLYFFLLCLLGPLLFNRLFGAIHVQFI